MASHPRQSPTWGEGGEGEREKGGRWPGEREGERGWSSSESDLGGGTKNNPSWGWEEKGGPARSHERNNVTLRDLKDMGDMGDQPLTSPPPPGWRFHISLPSASSLVPPVSVPQCLDHHCHSQVLHHRNGGSGVPSSLDRHRRLLLVRHGLLGCLGLCLLGLLLVLWVGRMQGRRRREGRGRGRWGCISTQSVNPRV